MPENILTQVKVEGRPAFPTETTENDNSATSSTDQTNTDQTQSQEGDQNSGVNKDGSEKKDNFADHPRWKERESDWTKRFNEQETRHVSELTKLREEFDQKFKTIGSSKDQPAAEASVQPPSWFGGDESQWKEFMGWNQSLIAKAKQEARTEALQEVKQQSESQQKAIDEATTYFNTEVAAIESDEKLNPDKRQVDRNKLLKFVLDNDIVDSKGRWNYRAAFKSMSADQVFKAKEALNERKQIANATTSENRAESKPQPYTTTQDFKKPENRPW